MQGHGEEAQQGQHPQGAVREGREAKEMIRELENLCWGEKLKELRAFSLEEALGRPYWALFINKGGL